LLLLLQPDIAKQQVFKWQWAMRFQVLCTYDPKQWQGCGIFFDDILSIVSTSVIFFVDVLIFHWYA